MNFGFLRPNGNLLEKFLRACIPFTKVLTPLVTSVGAGTTEIMIANMDVDGFSRLTGSCRSDVALFVNVYQGPSTTKNYVTTIPIPANATEGNGAAFSVEVVSSKIRIDVTNSGMAGTTILDFEAILRSL